MVGRVSSPSFVGRIEELRRLDAAFEGAQGGEPALVLIGGDAGVGKTRLVGEFSLRAIAAGAQVLSGGCFALAEGELPYAPVAEALRRLARAIGTERVLAHAGPSGGELARLAPELGPSVDREEEGLRFEAGQSRLFAVTLSLLESLSADAPVVLAIEDLHWSDRSTRDLLSFLARNLHGARVLVLVTFRTDELHRRHPLRPFLAEMERIPRAERFDVPPFARNEVAAQVEAITGSRPAPSLIDAVFARSEGNPFFAEELVATGADAPDLPPSLRDILVARLEALPPATQEMLRLAAVAGCRVPHELIERVTRMPAQELLGLLRDAVAHQVLVPEPDGTVYTFRHALLHEAVYGDLLPGERRGLHAAFAEVLREQPQLAGTASTPAAELAYHYYEAHDLPAALEAAVEAGDAARRMFAFAEAVQQYERALEIWEQVPDAAARVPRGRVELLLQAAAATSNSDNGPRAVQLSRQALELVAEGDPVQRALVLERVARYLWESGDEECLPVIRQALDLLPAAPSVERARVLGAYSQMLMLLSRYEESRVTAEDALAMARAAGARREEGHTLNTLGTDLISLGAVDEGIAALEEAGRIAEEVGHAHDIARYCANMTDTLRNIGRLEEALVHAERAVERTRQLGMTPFTSTLLGHAVSASVELGRIEEGERYLARALEREMRGVVAIFVRASEAALYLARGDLDAAEAAADEAALYAGKAADPQLVGPVMLARAEVSLRRGDHAAARAAVDASMEKMPADGFLFSVPTAVLGLRIEADAPDPEPDRVARLLAHVEGHAGRAHLTWMPGAVATARAEAARAGRAIDPDAWEAAAEAWSAARLPLNACYARWRQAEALLERRDRARATQILADAHTVARRTGGVAVRREIEALARRAGMDLGDSVVPDDGLTAREREVLALVTEGMTNRQIAEKLFISDKTASVHVSNILGKLGVENRGQAAAVARERGLV